MQIPWLATCASGVLASACTGADFSVASEGFVTIGGDSGGAEDVASGTSVGPGPPQTSGPGIDTGEPGPDSGDDESSAGCTPTPAEPCAVQAVGSIAAIGDDGNVAANAFDRDLATRWSFSGVGAWISFDLGQTRELCELRIAWYRGDERVNDFRIEASVDGTDWALVHSGSSSGTTAALESYVLDGSAARWARVVVLGNSDNDWASISEIETDARSPAVGAECDSGADDGGDADEYDENGVLMMLPTDPDCFSWSLVGDPNDDPHFAIDGKDGFEAEAQADGSWYFEPREGSLASGGTQLTLRLHVSGTEADEDFEDHAELRERGYMTSDPDGEIGNQEMTAYVRLAGIAADDDTISKKIRGGRHSDGEAAKYAACVGLLLRYDGAGDQLFEKELFHPTTPKFAVDKELEYGTAIADGAWIGDKITSVRQPDGSVVNTQYIDLAPFDEDGNPKNNWQKVFEYVDDGEDVVDWTGKFSTWRIDEAEQVWVKYPSVRCVEGAAP
jgi:hypothetical protein